MKYLRRLLQFTATRLIIITVCLSIVVCAFYIAFNLGNAYVLISEGMEKRAVVAMTRENPVALNGYFTGNFLNNDPVLKSAFSDSSPYLPYNITDYEYSISIEKIWVWPWGDEIICTVVEHVKDIKGSVKAAYAASDISGTPASWKSGRYEIRLMKQPNGQWKIASIRQDANYKDTGDA